MTRLFPLAWLALAAACPAAARAETQAGFCGPEFAWLFESDAGRVDRARGLSRGADGSVYVCGSFGGAAQFGGITLRSAGASDGYLLKLGRDGQPLWARQLNANISGEIFDTVVDAEGNVVVCGSYSAAASPGPNSTLRRDFLGNAQVAVVKYDAAGTLIWGRYFGGDSSEYARTVAVNRAGEVFIGGDFFQTTQFGQTALTAPGTGVFQAKLSKEGALQWAQGGAGEQFQYELAAAGEFAYALNFAYADPPAPPRSYQAVLQKRRFDNGQLVWQRRSQVGDLALQFMAVDAADNIYLAGYFSESLQFAGASLASGKNGVEIALLRLNAEGLAVQAMAVGSPGLDFAAGLAVNDREVVLSGTISGATNLALGEVHIAFPSPDAQMFALGFSPDFQAQWGVALGNFGAEEVAYSAGEDLLMAGVAFPGAEGLLGSCLLRGPVVPGTDRAYVARRPVPAPVLGLSSAGSNQRIAWPKIYGDYILEQCPALGGNWLAVPGTATNASGFVEAFVPVGEGQGFFRLRKSP